MNRLRLIFFIFSLSVLPNLRAQTASGTRDISLGYPLYSQYLQNGLLINPAYAGARGALSGFLSYRMEWMGIDNAPVFQTLSLNAPMKNDRVGLGIMAQFMQFGVTRSKSIYASYSYNVIMGPGRLAFGLRAGVDLSNTDYTGIDLTDPGDPVFLEDGKFILPNIGAGVYYYTDKLFAGISVPQFLSYETSGTKGAQAYHSFNNYDFIITAGGLITFSDFLKFKPSMLLNYSFQEAKKLSQLDLNGNLILADMLWLGSSYRTTEKVIVGIVQIQVNPQLMLGFSYDFPVGSTLTYSKGGRRNLF